LRSKLSFLSVLVLVAFSASLPAQSGTPSAQPRASIHILDQWKLSEAGSWGHLNFDEKSRVLYIPRTGYVAVLDAETGKEVGRVTGFTDARAVALDDKGKYGYATDMLPNDVGYVRVFDRSTYQVVASITVGRVPSAVIFDPVTKTVFAFSTSARNAAVIDPATYTIVKTLALPGKPHLALTDGKGSIYVSFRGIGKLVRIDTAARSIASTWPTDPCAEFHGLTFDAEHRLLLGSCYPGQLIAMSADTGSVTVAGQSAADALDLAYDADRHLLLSGSMSGLLSVYRQETPVKYAVEEKLPTALRAGTLTVDSTTGRVFLVTCDFGPAPVSGPGMEEHEGRLMPLPNTFRVIVAGR
jgi:DNA-binding beta-propeller fold protein YncE